MKTLIINRPRLLIAKYIQGLQWEEHMSAMKEMRSAYKVFKGKLEGRRQL
jgi:hypothetical protein